MRVVGDLRAQLAACHIAEQAFLGLVERYGVETVKAYMQELIDYTERLTRAAIRELPDGEWSFEDWIDDDGVDDDQPIRLFVTMTKRGDHMIVDWTGTDPQVKGAINNTYSFTKAASYTAIRSVLPANIPNNEGVFRAIEVIAPPGTIANGVLPAACAARGLTGFRMVDCAFGCSVAACDAGDKLLVYTAKDVPSLIPDESSTTSTINVPFVGTVKRVAARVDIDHIWLEDVDISLKSPANTTINLSSDNGDDLDDYIGTVFDDVCPDPIVSGEPPFTGCFSPEQPLATLAGRMIRGRDAPGSSSCRPAIIPEKQERRAPGGTPGRLNSNASPPGLLSGRDR